MKASISERRLGKFSITRNVIYDNPELVKRIMGECIIVNATMKWHTDAIHYVAISDHFAVVQEDYEEIPIYSIQCETEYDDNGMVINIDWKFV